MKKPPRLPMAILMRLGPREEPLVGDLIEEYTTGRSRLWFWRQAVAAVVAGAIRRIRLQPVRTVGAMTTGWAVLLLLFGLFGDRAADGLANLVWDWDRQTMGYGTGIWWPFQICAALVSYTGFALSALVVARLHRGNPAMLLAYVASVTAGLIVSAVILEVLIHRYDGVPVPHTLFYLVSVTLPFHWRSGLLLVPSIMLVCGLLAGGGRPGNSQEIRTSRG
jgi:hypothetical protein